MCGIVGYRGASDGVPIVMDGLRSLEYRGYDSAGVAVVGGKKIKIVRAAGKLSGLQGKLERTHLSGSLVLGHTRWATHGAPTEKNAHPHRADGIVVVHNGIFENAAELKSRLAKAGERFSSDTDTEVFAVLVAKARKETDDLESAVRKALASVRGAFAVVVASAQDPDTLVAARWGCPLVAGNGKEKGEAFFASDIPALLPHTRQIYVLEDGEVAVASPSGLSFKDFSGRRLDRKPRTIPWDPVSAEKGGYKHFMLKEIHEQPQALVNTLGTLFDAAKGKPRAGEIRLPKKIRRVLFLACGTSHHASLIGRIWIERLAGIPAEAEVASEFRYRDPVVGKGDLCVFLSQSGETADTLAALKLARGQGAFTLAVSNVPESSIPRAAHAAIYTHAGPEVGVAATKTFLAQLAALFVLALELSARSKKISPAERKELALEFLRLPGKVEKTLALDGAILKLARQFAERRDFLFLGRGTQHAVALEGALKLKEISYIHAEGNAAGEMKHGPIALLDKDFPVVFLAPRDEQFPKVQSNIEEVKARGAPVIVVASEEAEVSEKWDSFLKVPETHPLLYPFVMTPPLQLLAYHVANLKGCDVDQPRNLAKSVTVE